MTDWNASATTGACEPAVSMVFVSIKNLILRL